MRVVLLLASVLALNTADTGTLGAVAPQLEAHFGISHARLGLLAAASSGVGAVASVPLGVLVDRTGRVQLLVITVAVWAVAMVASGLAPNYWWLLGARLLLGAAVGAAGPAVVSLTGDFIPPSDRAGVLGWILTGEIIGAGLGLLIGDEVAAVFSWRHAFFLLAVASAVLSVAVWRLLPEPGRGGAGWLPTDRGAPEPGQPPDAGQQSTGRAQAAVVARGVAPARDRVLIDDPNQWSLSRATTYLLSIPTNRLLIVASAMGYFFFAGMRTFVVVFVVSHFGIPQTALGGLVPVVGLAALVGAVLAGRLTDRALGQGHTGVRILVPAAGYVAAALFFVPGVWLTSLAALPLIALGAGALAASNPPLDAARLDIVPGRLWGRAESLRTVLRLAAEAVAPATFGWIADQFGGPAGRSSGVGLRDAFLIMLVPLAANGLILIAARGSYPVDVATAAASDRRQAG
ncbi:MFS transporter [Micromonospora sp. NPDC050200]|uniref:MFS transporter n=1 Tax=Micromonospora sp. NPDC050200 TaxID=3155664 RepID=UPI0033CE8655